MGRKTPGVKSPNYSGVIDAIEHWLQYDTPYHPDESHEESAHALECGDAQRALIAIGAALDKAKKGS